MGVNYSERSPLRHAGQDLSLDGRVAAHRFVVRRRALGEQYAALCQELAGACDAEGVKTYTPETGSRVGALKVVDNYVLAELTGGPGGIWPLLGKTSLKQVFGVLAESVPCMLEERGMCLASVKKHRIKTRQGKARGTLIVGQPEEEELQALRCERAAAFTALGASVTKKAFTARLVVPFIYLPNPSPSGMFARAMDIARDQIIDVALEPAEYYVNPNST